jgi:hypothetical protein
MWLTDCLIGKEIAIEGDTWIVTDVCLKQVRANAAPEVLYSLEQAANPMQVKRMSQAPLFHALASGTAKIVGTAVVVSPPYSFHLP